MKRNKLLAAVLALAIVAVYFGMTRMDNASASAVEAPMFEVDPFWPQPLPDHMVLGSAIGVGVDSRDHVFIVHRGNLTERTEGGADADPPIGECCRAAPPVLVFDPEGNLVDSWGGPSDDYVWPASNHGITVDHMDNVWIGGNGPNDTHVLKFSRTGEFLASYGEPEAGPADSNSETRFNRVAKLAFDAEANEAYLADGYGGRRVAVLDASTGAFKRYWGAYGNEPDDTRTPPYDPDAPLIQQFRTPVHCADPSLDGHVYVCDRPNNRIQVFTRDGTFVDEVQLAPRTLGDGSTWDVAFSRDPEQKYMYVADGKNMRVYVMDRLSLEVLTSFGDGGRQPGLFFAVHSIATDSQGNIYTTETYEGKRVQKFVYKGMGPVTAMHQGAPWPTGN
ncbi:MAG: hypothetical protein F4Z31_17400 [Gemmatimonadetes bacterium]|nr:hypothetical protein [Gemmatimonadota bacterium]MCY3676795.1 hypothetical protein [Gemmatimonadota bacterium]MYA43506.1 hypothetical protein [Gemmatimonadota bacterium]MYJ10031.1 hypothetical protein [Gemmatimonadota bacterium]